MQSPDVAASSPAPHQPARPRAGGPPRWLVVVLVLVIGFGFWSQRPARKEPNYIAPKLDAVLLSSELVPRPLAGNSHGSFRSASLAVNAASERLWILTSDSSISPGSLNLTSSVDGGSTFLQPVDIAKLLPPLRQLQGNLVRADSGTLYVVASGLAPKRGIHIAAILRSTDGGVMWQIWQQLPDEYSMRTGHDTRCVIWNGQVALFGYCKLESGETELWTYLIDENDVDIHAVRLASLPGRFEFVLGSGLPTAEQLHVSVTLIKTGHPSRVFIASLETDGESVTQTELALGMSEYPRSISLVEPHPGEAMAVVAYYLPQEPPNRSLDIGNFSLAEQQLTWTIADIPEARLWRWELESGTWVRLDDTLHGPRLIGSALPNGHSMLIEYFRDAETRLPKYRFHQLSTEAPGWLSYCEVTGPASTRPQLVGCEVLQDGEMLLLVDEEWGAHNRPLSLWRVGLEKPAGTRVNPEGSP